MAKLFVCSLLLVLLVQNGRAEQQLPDFQVWLNNAKQYLDGVAKDLKEKVGLPADPNGADVLRVVNEHNEKLAQNLKETGKKIEEELKSNEALQTVVANVKAKFNEEAQKLKENNSELAANFEKLGESLQGTWNTLTQEMEKSYSEFNKAGGKREELEGYFKSLYDNVKSGAKELEGVGSDKRPDFKDLLLSTKQLLEGRAEEMKKTMGLSDNINSEALAKMFKEHNEKMVRNLKETSKTIEEEFKSNPDLRSFLENLKIKFNEEAEKLKTAKSDNIGKSLESSWASLTKLMEQSYEEFQKAGGNKKELDKYFESFLNKLKQSAQEFEGGGFVKEHSSDFQELLNNTKQFLDERAKDLGLTNLQSEELTNLFREYNEKVVGSLLETSKEIEEKFKSNPDLRSFLENLKIKFNEEAEKLKTVKPDDIGKSLESSWASLTKLMEQFYEEFQKTGGNKKELDKYFESLLNKVQQSAQEFVFKSNPDLQPFIENLKTKFNKEIEKLNTSTSENIGKSFQNSWDSLTKVMQQLSEDFKRAGGNYEELEKYFVTLLNELKQSAQELKAAEPFKRYPSNLQDSLNNTKQVLNKQAEELRETIGFFDTLTRQGLIKFFREYNENLIRLLMETKRNIEEEYKSDPDLHSFIEKIKTKFNKEAEKLKSSDSENIGKSLQNNWDSLIKMMQQLSEDFKRVGGDNEELDKIFESFLIKLRQSAQEFKGGGSSKQTPPEIEEILKCVQNFLVEKIDELNKTKDFSDARKKELVKIFKETSKKLEEELKSNPELRSFIEMFRTTLNEEAEKLNTSNSENIGTSLQNTWDSVTDQIMKSYKEIKHKDRNKEELEKYFDSLLMKMKESVQELESKLEEFKKDKEK